MFTFTILLFPIALSVYFITKKTKEASLFIIIGFLAGTLTCAIRAFFTFSHRIILLSFSNNFWYFFLRDCFFPIVILYGVFLLVSTDTLEFKKNAFFPLICSFYTVFAPYSIISGEESKAIFSIFIKPIIIFTMIIGLSYSISLLLSGIENKKVLSIIAGSITFALYLSVPSIINSIWIINGSRIIWMTITILYIFGSFLPLIIKEIRQKK